MESLTKQDVGLAAECESTEETSKTTNLLDQSLDSGVSDWQRA